MNKRWQQWDKKWSNFSPRERVMLLLVALLGPLALIFVFLIEPALITLQKVPAKIDALSTSLNAQNKVLKVWEGQDVVDPNIAARAELKRLRGELSATNKEIKQAAANLVSPDQMLTLLHSVLADGNGVKVVSAKSLDVELRQLSEPAAEGEEPKVQAAIYVHPFELELEANYQGLYDYLQRLEGLEGVFFWDLLEYQVQEYPKAKVKLRVHTLSSEAGWLGA